MDEKQIKTKAELLVDIDQSWVMLNAELGRLTTEQMTSIRDRQGWSVKDHLIHMAAWERSVVFFLQGKPRHEGLGVKQVLYLEGDDDAINDAIYRQRRNLPLVQAFAQFRQTHEQLVKLVQSLSDSDLQKPYRYYLPEEAGKEDRRTAINTIYGNTARHFREHTGWIRQLVATP